MKRIAVNGVELGYSIRGETGGKPALIFAHGAFMRSTEGPYEELLALLADNYTVYALDLRGQGTSAGAVEGWTFTALADDIVAFARELGLYQPAYVGHSLGAFMGMFTEIRHPGTFSALCLLAPGPADPRKNPPAALQFLIEHGHDREVLRGIFQSAFVRAPGRMLELMLDAITMVDKKLYVALREQEAQTSIEDDLGNIAPPVLLICGAHDHVIPPTIQHEFVSKVPRFKEVVFSSEGHMLPNESPSMVAREIFTFLHYDCKELAAVPLLDVSATLHART